MLRRLRVPAAAPFQRGLGGLLSSRKVQAAAQLGDELPDPAHPVGCCLRVVAEFLRHAAGAARRTELAEGAPDRFCDCLSGRGVRRLQRRGE